MEGGPRSSGVGFFCFHALEETKQKKPTLLDRGPPLHVNRVIEMLMRFGGLTFYKNVLIRQEKVSVVCIKGCSYKAGLNLEKM